MTFPQAIPQFCSVPIQVGKRNKKGQTEKKSYQPSLSGNLNCTLTPVTSIIPFQKFA